MTTEAPSGYDGRVSHDPHDLDGLRSRLVARREALRTISDSTSDSRKPVELDQTTVGRLSRMDAMQVQAMAQASERRREQEAARIDAALKRIDDGEFGYCANCGDAIAPKRLAIDPTVPTCVRCASGADH